MDKPTITIGEMTFTVRSRKLTPRECFRLMGVPEFCINRIQATRISDTAQYSLAGNAIVVPVLAEIFRKCLLNPVS